MTKKTPDPSRSALRERCLQHFAILRIPISPEELDRFLDEAEQQAWPPLICVDRLLGEQAARRRDRSTERRVIAARFPERKTLETFDWNFNSRFIDRPQIEQLATGDFVRRHRNLILIGQSGVGKSHLGQALGFRLCALGYRVLYTTSGEMIRQLGASLADHSLSERLRYYFRWDVVLIDEFGFDRIERELCPHAAPLLYKVIEARHQKRSTAILTNLDFSQWSDYLSDPLIGMAFLDRFVEAATIVKIKKEARSYRAARRPDTEK
jgi:DNA replication protein DnaC